MYLYQRPGSAVWWARFSVGGRRLRMSTGCTGEQDAARWAKAKEGGLVTGQTSAETIRSDRVKWEEARADLLAFYSASGTRDVVEVAPRLAHVDGYFAGRRIASIGPADSTRYAQKRQEAGAANATVNRELAVLGRALRLAYEAGKLQRLPLLRKLQEAPARSGFFEDHEAAAVRRDLEPDLQLVLDFGKTYGWRTQSETLTREWRHVDLKAGTVRLDPGETKNREARTVYLTPSLLAAFQAQRASVRDLERRLGRVIPWCFPNFVGAARQSVGARHVRVIGERRGDFRRAWVTACRKAGVSGRLKHDLRRTAVRNLEQRGVPRSVAMKLTGHRTEAVYRRYAIVSDADLQAASRKLAQEASR